MAATTALPTAGKGIDEARNEKRSASSSMSSVEPCQIAASATSTYPATQPTSISMPVLYWVLMVNQANPLSATAMASSPTPSSPNGTRAPDRPLIKATNTSDPITTP